MQLETESISQLIDRLAAVVPDYPEPGISFKDLTPVFADAQGFKRIVDAIVDPFRGTFDVIAGLEARGFILASAAAYATGTGMLTIRKKGKLPRETFAESYQLEYGEATLEVHCDDVPTGTRVLILDDVLATGGTLGASTKLVERAGGIVVGIGVVLELEDLGGRGRLSGRHVHSLSAV
ncbi:adenine phosphoribosyltransferase [Neomicrococcus lactis]|uniref:Adenine phosphoribosyltransferase n=1 Tax=Neomicrococcus lactis TaxID=732241 RepID=A0A7W8YAI3_9MICC|nr:adenine phosphoribosyltransferase [Neomicrococcus lactis]MBB5597974.1 adenine phosphoribosyltransferase [Neomicrococcus lactis]